MTKIGISIVCAMLLASCANRPGIPEDAIVFHMPAEHEGKSCHLYVNLSADMTYEVTKRFRSYYAGDPNRGVLKRTGTVTPEAVKRFITDLDTINAGSIDDSIVRTRMAKENNLVAVADGLEFDYTIRWQGFYAEFNELSQYMDIYPNYPEFIIGQKALGIFRDFGEQLFNLPNKLSEAMSPKRAPPQD